MRSKILLLAALVVTACSPEVPARSEPILVTLGTFEGEMDPVAGTFSVRSTGLSPDGTSRAALTITEGASGVTIANNGTPTQGSGTGTCAGFTVLSTPVRITRGGSNTGFAGGLYAEIQTITGTGGEACNADSAPTGLSATKGLWSYGTVRTGATTSDRTWSMKVTSGQKTTFTGRIVGVAGTTFAVTANLPKAFADGLYRSPLIVYAREKVAYASSNGKIVYANLDGTYASAVTLPNGPGTSTPESANAIAFYLGANANADALWFTTFNFVGVVYQGTVYSARINSGSIYASPLGGTGVTVDPDTAYRAWFVSRSETGFRRVDFSTAEFTVLLSSVFSTPDTPFTLAIGPATTPDSGNQIYVEANLQLPAPDNTGNWIKTYSLVDGTNVGTLTLDPGCTNAVGVFPGPDGKLYWGACGTRPTGFTATGCWFCSYTPGTATYQTFDNPHSSCSVAFAKSVMGANGDAWVPWGLDIDFQQASPNNMAVQLTSTGTAAKFMPSYPDLAWATAVPAGAGTPEVTVGATTHPPYLWIVSGNGLVRMQP